jgi:hypothetical protein
MADKLEKKYPADPRAYIRSDDFLSALDHDERHFYLKDALASIRHGELSYHKNGNAEAEWVYDRSGVKIYVLVGYDKNRDAPVLVTGWPALYNPREAMKSGHWREDELRDIHRFNGGSGKLEQAFDYP